MSSPPHSIAALMQAAQAHHQAGRLAEAENLYRQVLQAEPEEPDALHLSGLVAYQAGSLSAAGELIGRALKVNPAHPMYHNNLGLVLRAQGSVPEAIAAFRVALGLYPAYVDANYNLGLALQAAARFDEAIDAYRRALELRPDFAEAHNNIGSAALSAGRAEAALPHLRQAVTLQPTFAEAFGNLGLAHRAQGQVGEAIAALNRAVLLKPDFTEALCNLGSLLTLQGDFGNAASAFARALDIAERPVTRSGFATAARQIRFNRDDTRMGELLTRAITEAWARPVDLVQAAISLIKQQGQLMTAIDQCGAAWPQRLDFMQLFGPSAPKPWNSTLLEAVLVHAPVADLPLERYLTSLRRALLLAARDTGSTAVVPLPFHCTLARQCYNNEYVFSCDDEEFALAVALRHSLQDALAGGQEFPLAWLPVVSSYFVLGELDHITSLAAQHLTPALAALVDQQVTLPAMRVQLSDELSSLSAVEDKLSQRVRSQYEENPYPRWVKSSTPPRSESVPAFIRHQLPRAPYRAAAGGGSGVDDILIAGCGTGQHSIQTAQQFPDARVLALDLSRASLAYALQKTRELAIANLEYAHADILSLVPFGRRFDLIESVGVLHHLADPEAGWRRLLRLLHPDGVMRIALYSEAGRCGLAAARQFIVDQGFAGDAPGIRRCRDAMTTVESIEKFRDAISFNDFYSISECRDLLFHVHELRFTLPQLAALIARLDLQFLGWVLPHHVLAHYAKRFPEDRSATQLENWHAFEKDHPDTFAGMYHFFVQPRA